jgi:hypothetical protein
VFFNAIIGDREYCIDFAARFNGQAIFVEPPTNPLTSVFVDGFNPFVFVNLPERVANAGIRSDGFVNALNPASQVQHESLWGWWGKTEMRLSVQFSDLWNPVAPHERAWQ